MASGKSDELAALSAAKTEAAARQDAPGGGQDGADAKPPADLAAKCAAATQSDEMTSDEAIAELEACGIRFIDAADFLAAKLPPPEWIVKDFIARKMKGDLCGTSKTNKTFLAGQLGESVAGGKDFLGTYKITEPHNVAYVNLELFDWNFQERMTAQTSTQSTDPDTGELCGGLGIDREALRGKMLICNLRGNAAALRDKIPALVAFLKSRGIELIIIDPRYKLLKPGEDENTGDGLRGILEMRDAFAEYFAVLLVTHDPKGDTAQKKTTDRGAGSYTAGADFDFRLTIDRAAGWSKDNLVYVVEAEGRARKTPPPLGIRFDETAQIFRPDERSSRHGHL